MADDVMAVDAAYYTCPDRLALEKKKLFGALPLLAGLTGDLPNAGDRILFEETGVPIVLVRGKDGVVRGFLNRCPHRGAKLVEEPGRKPLITCPFHGWGFDLEGNVAAIPGEAGFDGMDDSHKCLTQVPVAEWHGLIFVRTDPKADAIDVEAFLGTFAPELAQLPFEGAEAVKKTVMPVQTNWKYALDTYGEGYHFAALHKDTLSPAFHSNVAVFDSFAPHHRVNFPAKAYDYFVDQPDEKMEGQETGFVHFLFPNTIIFYGSVLPGDIHVQVFRLFPGDTPGRTQTQFAVYAVGGVKSDDHRAQVEMSFDATAHVVTTEDYRVAALGYKNLEATPGFTAVFGRNEIALQSQHRAFAKFLES